MRAINFPFRLDSFGRVVDTTDQRKIYLDRILTVLSTINGQRTMRPTYGVDLTRGIYETGGDMQAGMQQAIRTAITTWVPDVSIEKILITEPNMDGISTVDLSVTLPDKSTATVSVNTAYLTPDGTIYG